MISINQNQETVYKSLIQSLTKYFTRNVELVPQLDYLFQFKIGDNVYIYMSPTQRKDIKYKYSLYYGKII